MKEYWTVPATNRGWWIGNDEDGPLVKVVIEDAALARQITKLLNNGELVVQYEDTPNG